MTRAYTEEYSNTYSGNRRSTARRRQQQVRRRRRIVLAVSFIILMASVFCFGTVKAKASSQQLYKYYTIVEVQSGDTLWNLAETYTIGTDISVKDYVKELKRLNHLPDGSIRAGEKITMICYAPEH